MIVFASIVLAITTISFIILMGLAGFLELLTIFENVKEDFKR